MRTTIEIDDKLLAKAREYAELHDESAVVQIALKAFLEREAGRRLARMGERTLSPSHPRVAAWNDFAQRYNADSAVVFGITPCAALDRAAKSEPWIHPTNKQENSRSSKRPSKKAWPTLRQDASSRGTLRISSGVLVSK